MTVFIPAPLCEDKGSRAEPIELYPDTYALQLATVFAQAVSRLAFCRYGALALLSDQMVAEFERYRVGRLRVVIAALQILGGLGLLAGYFVRSLLLLSAGGLTAMMLIALLVRVRIRDPLATMVPAFLLMCLNRFLVVRALA